MNQQDLFSTVQAKVLKMLQAKMETVSNAPDLQTIVESVPTLLPCPKDCGLSYNSCAGDCKKCWENVQSF